MSNTKTGIVAVFLATLGAKGFALFRDDKDQDYAIYNGTHEGNHLVAGPDELTKIPVDSEPGKAIAAAGLAQGDRITFDAVGEIIPPAKTQSAPAHSRKAGCANRREMDGPAFG